MHGMNRGGRLLGFPTANIKLEDELFPKKGVYAIRIEVDGDVRPGVANIGKNPTFGNDALSVEAHILIFLKIYTASISEFILFRESAPNENSADLMN